MSLAIDQFTYNQDNYGVLLHDGETGETALIDALKSGRLFAAGLDVFETEPAPIREDLYSLPNVFCLPHIASATWESRSAMAMRVLANIDAYFEKGAPLDRVA